MAVRIRMKQMGRTHRHFYRIIAVDHRAPRDGRAIEELGTYDPFIPNVDQRVTLKASRIKYWLGVGAKPSDNVAIFLKKYMDKFEKIEAGEYVPEPEPVKPKKQPPPPPAEESKAEEEVPKTEEATPQAEDSKADEAPPEESPPEEARPEDPEPSPEETKGS